MPVFINEVLAEVEPVGLPDSDLNPKEEAMPLSQSEFELMQAMALIEERRERLTVD